MHDSLNSLFLINLYHVKIYPFPSQTDIGLKRQANEDNYGTQSTVNGEVFIVCDGMGGHVGGEQQHQKSPSIALLNTSLPNTMKTSLLL